MNLIFVFTAIIQLARESIELSKVVRSLVKQISSYISKRKKH